mmetsp:Transcript_21603/g.38336  ORF Transcript_21603/g.38336 Transcript_21603/m.38336 type:complete len:426 (+) Transcript_21603:55-1332(+)|eukprot:CAMPEP_0197529728 /NCGR_PEP_ID=MMETSP1318-20131121/29414_1 /TAXON_ID=552666 /ORGANISM="Partenskyella glossopodia, Strain RCC365" /LENGTH=425 /DNA_ID=CAMNT_0043085305 /DNA_START=16 /DNA_END=1293 /DNA_ORIENTATION=-
MDRGSDPLTLLREVVRAKQLEDVVMKKDAIEIKSFTFPRKTKTAYRSKKGKGSLFTLEALVFFLQQGTKIKYGQYVKKCNGQGIMTVPRVDHKSLKDYLNGVVETSEYIDTMALVEGSYSKAKVPGESKRKLSKEKKQVEAVEAGVGLGLSSNERLLFDRSNMLTHPTISFANVTKLFHRIKKEVTKQNNAQLREKHKREREKQGRSSSKKHKKDHRHSHAHGAHAKQLHLKSVGVAKIRPSFVGPDGEARKLSRKRWLGDRYAPIIIVPNAASSLLTIYNAKMFFENKKYIPTNELKRTISKKPKYVEITKEGASNPEKKVKIIVVDDVRRLSYDEWHQVVAVFVTGATWQFHDFPFKTPAEVFSRIHGFYLHMKNSKPKKNIDSWNVKKLSISDLRYQDQATVYAFWKALTPFMQARFPHLLM